MAQAPDSGPFVAGRKQQAAISAAEAWQVLCSPEVLYGFLGTHGIKEEGNVPYVVPMNFVAHRQTNALYLHSSPENTSKRNRALKENAQVSFTVVTEGVSLVPDPQGRTCKCSLRYTSVMVFGPVAQVESADEKVRLLSSLMQQKAPAALFSPIRVEDVENTAVWKIEVQHISGKRAG